MAYPKPVSGNRFPKSERLRAKKSIELIHQSGIRISQGELMCLLVALRPDAKGAHFISGEGPIKVLITVSSHKYRKAVERNRIKRILRELYRLNKGRVTEILEKKELYLLFSIGFRGALPVTYGYLKPVYLKLLDKIANELEKTV
jgi:ribonuclease P protein component